MDCSLTTPDGRPLNGVARNATLVLEGEFGRGLAAAVAVGASPCSIVFGSPLQLLCVIGVCRGTVARAFLWR